MITVAEVGSCKDSPSPSPVCETLEVQEHSRAPTSSLTLIDSWPRGHGERYFGNFPIHLEVTPEYGKIWFLLPKAYGGKKRNDQKERKVCGN